MIESLCLFFDHLWLKNYKAILINYSMIISIEFNSIQFNRMIYWKFLQQGLCLHCITNKATLQQQGWTHRCCYKQVTLIKKNRFDSCINQPHGYYLTVYKSLIFIIKFYWNIKTKTMKFVVNLITKHSGRMGNLTKTDVELKTPLVLHYTKVRFCEFCLFSKPRI